MGTTTADRLEHERAFHDDRYRNDPRAAQDKFYEGLADSRDRFRELTDRFSAEERVLEIGCGVDSAALRLAERGVQVVGIDLSPVAVEASRAEARRRCLTTAEFRVMNAEALDLDDQSFDGVIGSAILHHLDVGAAFAEMARVLRPTGRAVFVEPLGHNPAINAYRRRTPESRTLYEHPLRWQDYGLAQRFFGDVHVETFHLVAILTSPIALRWWGRWIHRSATALDRVLLGLSQRLRWQAWVAVSEFRGPR